VEEGILHKNFMKLDSEALPVDRALYLHQEIAIRKAVKYKRNLVIATGTGSGKTECFLIPILNYLFEQSDNSQSLSPGVRALLLYPMNALANDQLQRLRRVLKPFPYITFGRYTGETKTKRKDAKERFLEQFPCEEILPNELLCREEMRERPPHFLLTNYAMLEYLLLRPKDCELFSDNRESFWKFIVMDEAHIYNGALGIEIAMLLRRLKERIVKSEKGKLQCFATSATLGKGQEDYSLITDFARNLFGEIFEAFLEDDSRVDVVEAKLLDIKHRDSNPWGEGYVDMYHKFKEVIEDYRLKKIDGTVNETDLIQKLEKISDEFFVPDEVREKARQRMRSKDNFYQGYLFEVLRRDQNLIKLQNLMDEGPQDPRKVAESIWGQGIEPQVLLDLVSLSVQAKADLEEQPLLPARYHLFVRALEGVFISLKEKSHDEDLTIRGKEQKTLPVFLTRKTDFEIDGVYYKVFELATCRRCGQEYLVGMLTNYEDIGNIRTQGNYLRFKQLSSDMIYENLGEKAYLLFDPDLNISYEINEDEEVECGPTQNVKEKLQEYLLCIKCGVISSVINMSHFKCDCKSGDFELIRVKRAKGQKTTENLKRCVICGGQSRFSEIANRFLTGQDAPVTVIATTLYQRIPPSIRGEEREFWGAGRKLLLFSDSRQDAAFFAPYLKNTYFQFMRRRLILNSVSHSKFSEGYRLDDFTDEIYNYLRKREFFPYSMSRMEQRKLISKWVIGEIVSYDRKISLEGSGLLQFKMIFPRRWKPSFYFKKPPWNLQDDQIINIYQVLLDTLRQRSIMEFPENVDPKDEFFLPRNFEFYIRGDGSDAKRHIFSWIPGKHSRNARYDYLSKIFSKITGKKEPEIRPQIIEALKLIWEKDFTEQRGEWIKDKVIIPVRPKGKDIGVVYQLNPNLWEAVPTLPYKLEWYRCKKCSFLFSLNVMNVCPNYRCDGSLEIYDVLEDVYKENNHYRYLYLNLEPISMDVHEHTAQLTSEYAAKVQQNFIRGEVNVLSCSTTFELGVDLGELQTVLMRNIPPETANYVQRAGRAGRRADSAAFIVTYAQRRSHDLTHFNEPERMVGGKVNPPQVEITNAKILRRHLHSQVFSYIFKTNPETFGFIANFFLTPSEAENQTGLGTLKMLLKNKPEDLKSSLLRIIPENFHKELKVQDWGWEDNLFNGKNGLLDLVVNEITTDLQDYKDLQMAP